MRDLKTNTNPQPRPFLISFLLPSWRAVRSYRTHLEEMDPLDVMTGGTAPSSEGFLGCKANIRRSVHSLQDHLIIILIISGRRDWHNTRVKWPLARNPYRRWWHRHTNWKFFWPQSMAPWTTRNKRRQRLKYIVNNFKYHVFAPMGRFQLELIYLYFPPSSHQIMYVSVL